VTSAAIRFSPADFGIKEGMAFLDEAGSRWVVLRTFGNAAQLVIFDADGDRIRTKTICPFVLTFTHKRV